jgi:DNA adenine methylase
VKITAKPFLKWAGGKSQLLSQFEGYYPRALRVREIKKYVEPFLGGGAVFFEVSQRHGVERACLSDVNKDLVLTYWVVQQKPDDLLDYLEKYQQDFDTTASAHRNDLFLAVRGHFNQQRFEVNYKKWADNWVPRAAQMIFLNKTCFNGLFRLNSKGEFNVPFGKYPNPTILDERNIQAASRALQKAEIKIAGYEACFDEINASTFVYFDPPYRPLSKTASFTNYVGAGFTDQNQLELAAFFKKIDIETNARLMLSNSDPKNEDPEDDFFEKAFSDYNLFQVSANRAINSKGEKRGAVHELVITNYQHEPQALAFDF